MRGRLFWIEPPDDEDGTRPFLCFQSKADEDDYYIMDDFLGDYAGREVTIVIDVKDGPLAA